VCKVLIGKLQDHAQISPSANHGSNLCDRKAMARETHISNDT